MSLPQNRMSTIAGPTAFLVPDRLNTYDVLLDYERGGTALYDAAAGVNVRDWTFVMVGDDATVYPNTAPGSSTVMFTETGITHISGTFDQNMNFTVAYIASGQAKLNWFNSLSGFQETLTLASGITFPVVTLDDKRDGASGRNDILLFYIRVNKLYMRQQRDRFGVEYLMYTPTGTLTTLTQVGMTTGLRVQLEMVEVP